MFKKTIVRKKSYFDSVTLMSLNAKIKTIDGVIEAVIAMATEMNLEILHNTGLATEEVNDATPNDLLIGLALENEELYEDILSKIDQGLMANKDSGEKETVKYSSIDGACKAGDYNLAVISIPGRYAAFEAMKALKNNLHVMLFSDNVTVEDERELKEYGRDHGLLVMGPDCGTAEINNVGLCFANANKKGNIGIVAASGTGLQEVLVMIDKFGGGISQAIGVGGRDLSKDIGGIMMMEGIKALNEDENTDVIVLVSKPPYKTVQEEILKLLESVTKPVVICFIDGKITSDKYIIANSLVDAAYKACLAAKINIKPLREVKHIKENYHFNEQQKYLRGLFCGGTLTSEALSLCRNAGLEELTSNVAKIPEEKLKDVNNYQGNVLIDLGDDVFTNGRPHPMIEPSIRLDWILKEANDPTVKVILLDFELGYGSHQDPVGISIDTCLKAKQIAKENNRDLAIVGYVQGSYGDKQGYDQQVNKLLEAGILTAESNYDACKLAIDIVKGVK